MATTSHYVVLCLPSWGHCRPELTFALRLVKLHPHLYITIFLPSFISQSTDAVIFAAQLSNTDRSRMAVINYSMAESVPEPNQANADDLLWKKFADSCADELIPTYQEFIKSEHVKARPVDVILGDGLLYWGFKQHLETMSKELGIKIPEVYFLAPVSAAYTISVFSQDSPFGNAMQRYVEEVDAGKDQESTFRTIFAENDLRVDVPGHGAGPMYIWEMDPTESCGCRILSPFCLHEARVRYHMRSWNRLVRDLDDAKVIVFWPAVLGEQVDPPLKLISVGPQIFTETGPGESDHPSLTWLSNKPDHSVIYIAFGSYFSHGTTHQIDYLFNALGASGLSVLFSRVGGDETMHKHVDEGIGRLGEKGLACDWVPQEQVLAHPATGWFCTHGGSNSAQEGMLYGVPMRMFAFIPNFPYTLLYPGRMGFLVVWPAAWDQPHIANELVHLGIAIELVQVRTGLNVGRTMARGTKIIGTIEAMQQELQEAFETMLSEKGDEMRKRAREVMDTVRKDMQEGKSWENMVKIGKLMA